MARNTEKSTKDLLASINIVGIMALALTVKVGVDSSIRSVGKKLN